MRRRLALLGIAILLVVGQLLLFAGVAAAAEIDSNGPLTQIFVTPDLSCQVAHVGDEAFELFGSEVGSCGTFLAVNNTVFGPSAGYATSVPFTPQAQTQIAGSGSSGDPLHVVTVADAAEAGIRIQQTDSYVIGSQSYRTDIQLTNGGPNTVTGILYRYGDCFLQNYDTGYGRVDAGAPACIVDPSQGQRIEQWTPLTAGSHYFEGYYGDGYDLIGQQVQFTDTCVCDQLVDNGAGLSWPISVSPGQTATFSHETYFSPTGRAPVTTSFNQSVPDPTQLNLDPVVVVTNVVATAGVILLVPFPSALFNATLEDNYDEVMAGVNRLGRRTRAGLAALITRLRVLMASRRQSSATASEHPLGGPLPGESQPAGAPGPEMSPRATALVEPSVSTESTPTPAPTADQVEHDVWRTPLGIVGFIVLSALLYAFLDPTFGFSLTSLATLLGLSIGLLVILVAYGTPIALFSRNHHLGLSIRALPATLAIAVICVLVSRLSNFQPGYLYGLVIGFFFIHEVSEDIEGRAEAVAAGTSLVAALIAWIVLALLRGSGNTDAFTNALLQASTVTVVVAGLENAVFAMLPLRFLPGAAVKEWNWLVWAALIGLGVFGFVQVLLSPAGGGVGYLADPTQTSFFTMLVLLVVFAVVSALFWGWFRFRPDPNRTEGQGL
ncbi:MAG TPA: FGLLP motif-containing membrane protein [Candidatus Limnocylindrales bacterium]